MEGDKCLPERSEFAVSSPYIDVLRRHDTLDFTRIAGMERKSYAGTDGVSDVTAAALGVLTSVHDLDVEVGVLVEDLLDATVISALLGLYLTRLGEGLVVFIVMLAVTLVLAKRLVLV